MFCPVCGKEITPECLNEDCPNSPYTHGKHPVIIVNNFWPSEFYTQADIERLWDEK